MLKRKLDSYLKEWKTDPNRKPLIVKVELLYCAKSMFRCTFVW